MSTDDEVNDYNSNDDNEDISDDDYSSDDISDDDYSNDDDDYSSEMSSSSDEDISDDDDYSSDDNSNDDNYDAALLFVYTGVGEGANVPNNVVRVRIDPSLLAISPAAFKERFELEEVEFHDGIHEIGSLAFYSCRALREVQLSDGVRIIGKYAFSKCNFIKFRCPPLVTTITTFMLCSCRRMMSLEVPEIIIQVEREAFMNCPSLRNIALVSNTRVDERAFEYCIDLLRIFDRDTHTHTHTEEAIVNALKSRFVGLLIHAIIYYKPYHNTMTTQEFQNSMIGEDGQVNPSGMQQDSLGMTPLHILACSTVQCLELYQLIIEYFPGNLIVEDAWGATPLLYAVWGEAPSEILHFLVKSYQNHYPDHEFDWNAMVITLACAQTGVIQNLLDIQQTLSPGYSFDWDTILESTTMRPATYCFLISCSIATRVNAIGIKHFRDEMADDWIGDEDNFNPQGWRNFMIEKLEYYESEYQKLKEMTSLLELALWKAKMADPSLDHQGEATVGDNKNINIDQSEFRLLCHTRCGANYVIENVLPYLLPIVSNIFEEFDEDFFRTIWDSFQNEEDVDLHTYIDRLRTDPSFS